jgi:DNA-binding NarL/FixJ family response regulator
MSASPIRLVLADDHTLFRAALRRLLESEPGMSVVGEASDGVQAVKLVRRLQPDLLILDIAMPNLPGLGVLRELNELPDGVRTVVLAAEIEHAQLMEALRNGARGVLMKDSSVDVLFEGIRAVMGGEYWIGGTRLENLVQFFRTVPLAGPKESFGLTPRELQVVRSVVAGNKNRDAAERLSISPETIKRHLSNIFDKLGVTNRMELAVFAYSHRIVEDPLGTGTHRLRGSRA